MKSIGIKLADGTFYPIMEEGNAQSKNLKVTTVKDNQTTVQIDVYRSASLSMDDAEYVDSLQIENLKPHPNGEPSLDLDLGLDEDNKLHAEVRDPETGKSSETTVTLITRSQEERNEPVNFSIDSDDDSADKLAEGEEVIGPDPNSEDFSFDSLEDKDQLPAEKEENKPEETEQKTETPSDSVDFDFDAADSASSPDSIDFSTDDFNLPDELDIPFSKEESEIEDSFPPVDDFSIPDESVIDMPDLSQASDLVDEINAVPDNTDSPADTENAIEEDVADDFNMPDFDAPDNAENSEIDLPVFDGESSDTFEDNAPLTENPLGDLSDLADDSDSGINTQEIPDFTAPEDVEDISTEGPLPDFDLPDFGDVDLTTQDKDEEKIPDLPSMDDFDISALDVPPDTPSNAELSTEEVPDSSLEGLPDLDLSNALTSVARDEFELPDFDSSSDKEDPGFNDVSTDSADSFDTSDLDFGDSNFGSSSSGTESLLSDNPLYSEDLYDKETLEGNSKSDDDSIARKTKAPVIICIICAIICVIAAALVLFVIPSGINIKERFLTVKPMVPTVSRDPEVQMKELEKEEAPVTEEPREPQVTEINVTASSVPQVTESAEAPETKAEEKTEEPSVQEEEAPSAPAAEEEAVSQAKEEPESGDAEATEQKEIEFRKEDTSAKEDEIVVVTTPEKVVPVTPPAPVKKAEDIRYKIKWGDTLWDISKAYYKNPWRYTRIANYNNIKDPDHIVAGTIIRIPAE